MITTVVKPVTKRNCIVITEAELVTNDANTVTIVMRKVAVRELVKVLNEYLEDENG